MKFLRKAPVMIAATAVIASPTAIADPVQLTVPNAQTRPVQPPAPPPPVAPAAAPFAAQAPSAQAPGAQAPGAQAPGAQASSAQVPLAPGGGEAGELRGPVGPLPDHFSINAPPPPPPAPTPVAQPAPAAAPAPPAPVAQATPAPTAPVAPAPTATLTAGVTETYTRLSFQFQAPTSVTPTLTGSRLDLRFSRAADLDLADVRAQPPRYVRELRRLSASPVRVSLTLDPGVRQRSFIDGNRVIVDLLPPAPGSQQASSDGGLAPVPAQRPVSGNGRVQLVEEANDTRVTVTWPAPARAAAFRRGEAIWILFDATGRIDLAGVARAGRFHQDMEVVRGEGVVGLRIPAEPDVLVSASVQDNSWTFTLGARAARADATPLTRQISAEGRGSLIANFAREGVVRWINDPEIGDRIGVALIGGPAKGVDARRATVEAALLPTAHGGVIETRADGVTATFDGGNLVVTRGGGLIAANAETPAAAQSANAAALAQALANGGADPAPPTRAMSLAQVRARIDELERRAANEGTMEGAPVGARMALARFLLQNEFAPEALGALRIVAVNQGEIAELDPEFRMMRGAANVMIGRVNDAQADLGSAALADNLSAALWRGYAAYIKQDWPQARRELERGAGAMEELPPGWRARFQLALAESALELNDLAAADAAANAALGQAPDQSVRLQARLIMARTTAARGDNRRALAMLDELSHVRDEEVAVHANLAAIQIRRETGVMRPIDAIEPLEALRFRWRGDANELQTVAMLGDVYSELGRWRDALSVMRTAADRYPAQPAARQLRVDMQSLFEQLFLDGQADRLEPIQALGLFYEFSDLTPVGANGDRIVRLLAGRLVHVDLLEQAAQLLQHQVDERLEGVGKAQVAADLAAIYLMDNQADKALVAINTSRQPNMPAALLAERRIIEARALLGLGRLEHAAELVERDRGEDAQRVRAEAAWRARDWEHAAVELRVLLSARNRAAPLDEDMRQVVLRTGIALTLSGDDPGVRALYREYAGDMAGTPEADAFEVVASGISAEGASIRDVARAVARSDLLDRFMTRLRTRMTAEAIQAEAANAAHPPQVPGAPAPAPPSAPGPQAATAPPSAPTRQQPRPAVS